MCESPDAEMVESSETAAEASLPTCPRCGVRVSQVTMRGPTEQVATPCGCSIAPGSLERS
ncbi:hypothetical protein [Natrinema caseinilyticum]|uniref:hypothetical protein n=1 Tax=Natrinema caseinilyticum TaxID=2961570 RepID=UPI0020C493D3|nr:hypothetical protein [Natrinema caseinilyticum]